jgi:hypothetical protein
MVPAMIQKPENNFYMGTGEIPFFNKLAYYFKLL